MTENLPDEVQYGFVYGKTLLAIGDTTDDVDRFPDGVAAKGIVRFTPKVTILRTETDPATIIKQRIECHIHQGKDDPVDPDPAKVGLLVDTAGHVGNVALVVGQYDVSYQLEGGASVPSFTIDVTPAHTPESPLDLALEAPFVPSPTVKFVVNEQVYLDTLAAREAAEQARDESEARVEYLGAVSGVVTLDVDGPVFYHATLTGDVSITPAPPTTPDRAFTVTVMTTQDGTGDRALTLVGVESAWSVPVVLTPTPGARDVIHLLWTGVDWIALPAASNVGVPS